MAAALLGHASCPLCGGRSRVTLSKNKLPVLTCSHCGIQLFARSERSDELIRDRLETEAPPAPEPVRTADPEPEPVRTDPAEDANETGQLAARAAAQGGGLMSSWFR